MEKELELAQEAVDVIVNFLVTYSFQLIGAVIILIAGFVLGGWVSRALLRVQQRRNVDVTLRQLIAGTVRLIIIGLFVIIAVSKLGISITPFIAALGGLAVGIGFAMQGPVSNYGAGFVIILTRLFKVGDTISVQGCSGLVKEITLATTQLVAQDGEDIVIPNKHVVGEILRNSYASRLVEGRIGIAYSDDPEQAIGVITEVLRTMPDVGDAPAQQVGIERFGDWSIDINYRFWVPTQAFFETRYAVNLAIFKAFGEAGLTIPYPQREVRLLADGVFNMDH